MALFLGGVGFNLQKSEIWKNRKIARLLYLVLVSSARNIERRSQICAYKVYSQILAKPRDDQHLFYNFFSGTFLWAKNYPNWYINLCLAKDQGFFFPILWCSSTFFSQVFGPFFPWKILCIGWNHIFQVEIWRNFAPKKTLLKTYYRMRGVITNISLKIEWQLPIITLCYWQMESIVK
jgi:hypothetical protein